MAEQTNSIDAYPTKTLFISMLVKDVSLADAVSDLVDNSVDGARRLRPRGDYNGLWIKVKANKESFSIEDNCGGISADHARHYAFRFGRAENTEPTPGSIGRFGIGMKRALFKMGNVFKVESTAKHSHFSMEVNVSDWQQERDPNWHFNFTEVEETKAAFEKEMLGTRITVTELDPNIASSFDDTLFMQRLTSSVQLHHVFNLGKGLKITINGHPLPSEQIFILQSTKLKPAFWEHTFNDEVIVKAYAGLGDANVKAGGWYIFCNGRLVSGPNTTRTTGWGSDDVLKIPEYHGQYDRFRGYVFFDSDDAGLLPWNTSKTSVDADSPIWKYARSHMIVMMRPVCDFLNKIHQERQRKDKLDDEKPLESVVESAKPVELFTAKVADVFIAPKATLKKRTNGSGRIQYDKPLDEIAKVKATSGAKSLREVGERTFEYYLQMECD